MENLNKNIEDITEQTEWAIPPKNINEIKEISDQMDGLRDDCAELKAESDLKIAQRALLRIKLWKRIHAVTDAPDNESLSYNLKDKLVFIQKENNPMGGFMGKLFGGMGNPDGD